MSTNFAWNHEYDVKFWRHKKRTPNTNDHHMLLNEPPSKKIFCVRHWAHDQTETERKCYLTVDETHVHTSFTKLSAPEYTSNDLIK